MTKREWRKLRAHDPFISCGDNRWHKCDDAATWCLEWQTPVMPRPAFYYTCDDGKQALIDHNFGKPVKHAPQPTDAIRISNAERQLLADLSEAIDTRTDLGDGDRKERAFWKRASNLVSKLSARQS